MNVYKCIIFSLLFVNIFNINTVKSVISDKRKCANPNCSALISTAVALITYNSDDPSILSFPQKAVVEVYSYGAGSKPDLWGIMYNGKRGYGPKGILQEKKVYIKSSKVNHIVPTEDNESNDKLESKDCVEQTVGISSMKGMFGIIGASAESVIKPDKVIDQLVIDGTTIYDPDSIATNDKLSDNMGGGSMPTNAANSNEKVPKNTGNEEFEQSSKNQDTGKKEKPMEVIDSLSSSENKKQEDSISEDKESQDGEVSEEDEYEDDDYDGEEEEIDKDESDVTLDVMPSATVVMGKKSVVESKSTTREVKNENTISAGDVEQQEDIKKIFEGENAHVPEILSSPKVEPNETQQETSVSATEMLKTEKETTIISKKEDIEQNMKSKVPVRTKHKLPEDAAPETVVEPGVESRSDDLNTTSQTVLSGEVKQESPVNTVQAISNEIKEDIIDTAEMVSHQTQSDGQIKPLQDLLATSKKEEKNAKQKLQEDTGAETVAEPGMESSSDYVNVTSEIILPGEIKQESPVSTIQTISNETEKDITDSAEKVSHQTQSDGQSEPLQDVLKTGEKKEKNTEENKNDNIIVEVNSVGSISDLPQGVLQKEETTEGNESTNITGEGNIDSTDNLTYVGNTDNSVLLENYDRVQQLDDNRNKEDNSGDSDEDVNNTVNVDGIAQELPFISNESGAETHTETQENKTDLKSDGGESESFADIDVAENTEQPVETNGKDKSEIFSVSEQEEPLMTTGFTEKPEEIYDAHVEEFTEESVQVSSETVNEKDLTSSLMLWISSSLKSMPSSLSAMSGYFQSPASYGDIPNAGNEEPSNTVSSIQDNTVDIEKWDQSKLDSSTEKSCLIHSLGEGSCEKVTQLPPPNVWPQSDSTSQGYEIFGTVVEFEKLPFETVLWLVITAVTVLVFTLGHYYIEAHRRDGLLVARINKLERELLVLRKESSLLEDKLLKAQDEIEAVDTSSSEAEALISSLKQELEESKAIRLDLEDQVTSLEKELESVTESGLEMHRLLSESLSDQDGSQVLFKTVENLREKLSDQSTEISLLNQSLVEKDEEIESLKNDIMHSQEMYKDVEERLNTLQREKEEEALELKDKHHTLSAQLEEVIETKALDEMRTSTEISNLKRSIEEVQRNLAEKEAELETMRDAIRQLHSVEKGINLDALYDVAAVSAKLKATEKEKDEYKEKFLEEEGARKLLEDHVRVISREVASLKEKFEAAEKEKIDALTKLQVLSNYFKEKESQLQKELGLQESMWLQKQSDDHTIYEQMKSLREENEKYKLQNESLKKEICEQESSFKIQIANIEQRSHENWVACRQSERRLKEVQQEASQLRNRLTLSEKNAANHSLDDSKPKISESNGDPSSPPPSLIFPATTSPPFMMYPGLPGEFIPPPPLVSTPFSPDSRPPPLGRISSPQLDPRFSPPPPLPYSPYDFPYGGHHSPSPPPPLPHRTVHKPQPRESAREQKDSVSTNYTSESLDKPSRRNKR